MQLSLVFVVVTPTRRFAATSPLKGEVEFPLLPDGEKRKIAAVSTLQATPGKSAVGLLHVDLAGALESAGAKFVYMTPSGAPFDVFCRASQVLLRFPL
ncbi:hypothetical protein [Pararhizobium sp. PWRC1-1]|uniref:hypothetical protein n=1 Tax=Pararhizobium sp. PWRC1-1 TaxID=2804566 RepID=UPI003CF9C20C